MRLSCIRSATVKSILTTQILALNKLFALTLMDQVASSVKNALTGSSGPENVQVFSNKMVEDKKQRQPTLPMANICGGSGADIDDRLSPDALRSQQWKKPTESLFLVQQLARQGLGPRQILATLYPRYCTTISDDIPDEWIMQLLRELCEQRTRQKLANHNTFEDAVQLFRRSKRILVITGAGVSVSCGIPDFRSENGVYARLKKDFPELPTPMTMFDIDFFRHNPRPFYNFAREIFPGQFRPSLSHMFIKFLEEENKLLRNYTQNIDTLERIAGISNLVECHGSFARATCLDCKHQVDAEQIHDDVFAQRVAHCPRCVVGVLKPDIVFFGEDLGDAFHDQMGADHTQLDLLVVIGSSMQVRPVSLIPFNIAPEVPQILINRQQLRSYAADIKLLGSCDPILVQIALAMGGQMRHKMLNELHLRRNVQNPNELLLPSDLLTRVDQHFFTHPKTAPETTTASARENGNGTNMEEKVAADEQQTMTPFFPRQITVDQFKQYITTMELDDTMGDQENGQHNDGKVDGEEGTAPKRSKMMPIPTTDMTVEQQQIPEHDAVPQTDSVGQQKCQNLWQSNYARVDAHLPSTDTLLFVPPNLNVFVGAELYYDRDQDTFVPRMGIRERRWDNANLTDDDDHDDDDDCDGHDLHDADDDHDYETGSSVSCSSSAYSSIGSTNSSAANSPNSRDRGRDNVSLPPPVAVAAAANCQPHSATDKSSQRQRKADSCPPAIPSDTKGPKK